MMEGGIAFAAKSQMIGVAGGVRPPRTFDQIDHGVTELAGLNKRLDAMLDRLGHCSPEEQCDNPDSAKLPQVLGTDYSRSLDRLQRELSDLASNVAALETHI